MCNLTVLQHSLSEVSYQTPKAHAISFLPAAICRAQATVQSTFACETSLLLPMNVSTVGISGLAGLLCA